MKWNDQGNDQGKRNDQGKTSIQFLYYLKKYK